MKKTFVFTFLLLVLFGITVYADTTTYESGVFKYVIQENGIKITSCTDYDSETIEIPSEIDGLPVVSVGGFGGNTRKLKKVIIPEGVIEIADMAFYWNGVIESVNFPNSLERIGRSAFYACESITKVHIPANVSEIGDEGSFRECTSLPAITVDEENQHFSSFDGVLYNKDKSVLYLYPAGKKDESFIVPDSVLRLENYCFYFCDFKSITISKTLQSIGENIFCYCYNLEQINFEGNNEEWTKLEVADRNDFSKIKINYNQIVSNKYIITYFANGGNEYIESTIAFIGENATITNEIPTFRSGYFLGWATTKDSKIPEYYPNDIYTKNMSISLYAIFAYTELGSWFDAKDGTSGFYVDLHNIPKGCMILSAQYLDDKFIMCEIREYSGEKEKFFSNKNANTAKVFVWKKLNNLIPITGVQEIRWKN